MSTILYVWMVLAIHGGTYGTHDVRMGWVQQGTFYSGPACHAAAKNLGISADKYRCIGNGHGEVR